MTKRLYISADIEGITGIAAREQLGPQGFEYEKARRLYTAEIAAAAEGAIAAGVDEIVVSDSHGNGLSLIPESLPDCVSLVRSWPRPLLMMDGIDRGAYMGCMLLGYHAGVGNAGGTLSHTMSSRVIMSFKVNGIEMSEAMLSAATAAHFGVPLLMISGDDVFLDETVPVLQPAVSVKTKESRGFLSSLSPSPQRVQADIRAAAAAAVRKAGQAKAYHVEGPYEVEMVLKNRVTLELLAYLPQFTRRDANTIVFTARDMVELNHILCFMMFYKFE